MNSFTGPSRWGLLDPLSRTIKAASNCGAAAAPCVLGSVAPAPADGMGTGISSPGRRTAAQRSNAVAQTNQCLKLLMCRVAMVPTAELGKPVLRLMLH
ncbi:unnamed protein product [Lampetra fluviatilis]